MNQQRQSSKASIPASSSVVTFHRIVSPTTRSGQPSTSSLTSQNPTKSTTPASNSQKRTPSPDPKRKNSAAHNRANSIGGITDGVGNLNRWSQSTVSSKSSATVHNKRSSFARRLSGSFGSFGGFGSPQSPTNKPPITKTRSSEENSKRTLTKAAPHSQPPSHPPPHPLRSPNPAAQNTVPPSIAEHRTPSLGIEDPLTPSARRPVTVDYLDRKWSGRIATKRQEGLGEKVGTSSTAASSPRTIKARTREHGGSRSELPPEAYGSPKTLLDGHRGRGERDHQKRPDTSHSRNREVAGKGSGGGSSTSSAPSFHEGSQRRKTPSQKAMLSKALQKANHAVQLDNAQNFEGAMDAYGDACDLLQQVMLRSAGDEDRKKLEAIRNTYKNRINELELTEIPASRIETKALPNRPTSSDSKENEPFSPITDDEAVVETVTVSRVSYEQRHNHRQPALTREQLPPRRQSLMPFAIGDEETKVGPALQDSTTTSTKIWSIDSGVGRETYNVAALAPPMFKEYMPEPLSPRRPPSPNATQKRALAANKTLGSPADLQRSHHVRQDTAESTSWLDTIDESDGSSGFSTHSRSSFSAVRRKHLRNQSGDTEANFDAALDAAVEAAYDDDLEPINEAYETSPPKNISSGSGGSYMSDIRRNVDIAKQRVREAEREAALALTKNQEQRRMQAQFALHDLNDSIDPDYAEDEAEEEERILEEMTRDYVMDDLEDAMQSKSALPRQSDSSGFSGRTWGSSSASISNTAATSLSTVIEAVDQPRPPGAFHTKPPPPAHPPPSAALPPPPPAIPKSLSQTSSSRPPSLSSASGLGVRERRLSGQKVKQLTIETNSMLPAGLSGPKTQPLPRGSSMLSAQLGLALPKSATILRESQQLLLSSAFRPYIPQAIPAEPFDPSSNDIDASQSGSAIPLTPRSMKGDHVRESPQPPPSPSPIRQQSRELGATTTLRNNVSSSSLKNLKITLPPVPLVEEPPNTPLSKVVSNSSQTKSFTPGAPPEMPLPSATVYARKAVPTRGTNYYDHDVHSLTSPGSPNSSIANPPAPLEPCPESPFLRPFWLLRCVYQVLAHPRGGYITTRLFVPRDVWLVKNVKLKNVEEKVANCDLLTAALLKFGRADTLDADAVLREMQALEVTLETVQAAWARKLGGDVGKESSAGLFKASPVTDDTGHLAEGLAAKASNAGGKYLSGWRKLRNKSSVGTGTGALANGVIRDAARDTLTMRSLPMSSLGSSKAPKRDVGKVQGIGQHASYMASLARLCDAAQVLDPIVRQVEDPGLQRSSSTYIKLEFPMRHAAEFFAFYVCRFVLADVEMMLHKFIKRGSEWAAL